MPEISKRQWSNKIQNHHKNPFMSCYMSACSINKKVLFKFFPPTISCVCQGSFHEQNVVLCQRCGPHTSSFSSCSSFFVYHVLAIDMNHFLIMSITVGIGSHLFKEGYIGPGIGTFQSFLLQLSFGHGLVHGAILQIFGNLNGGGP